MESNKKTKYYDWSIDKINQLKKESDKKTIGIHACCAPCACFPIEFFLLAEIFHIVILYDNSNIYPKSEYNKRLNELIKLVNIINEDREDKIELVIFDYDNENYEKEFSPYKDEPECGNRCIRCYTKRMKECYKYANERKFDYFTTVMSISRQKSSEVMNEIGAKLEKEFDCTKYFFSDFKKKGGQERAVYLKKYYDLYNQQYCGCKSSYEKYLERVNK